MSESLGWCVEAVRAAAEPSLSRALLALRARHTRRAGGPARFRERGGLGPLLELVGPERPRRVLELALSVLGNCCTEPGCRRQTRSLGGVPRLVSLLSVPGVPESVGNRVARTLANLALEPDGARDVLEAGAAPLLITLTATCSTPGCLLSAARALRILGTPQTAPGPPKTAPQFEAGGSQVGSGVPSALCSPQFEAGVRALCLLCREAVSRARVRRSGGLGALVALLREPRAARWHRRALLALSAFAWDPPALRALEARGLVPLLARALRRERPPLPPSLRSLALPPIPALDPRSREAPALLLLERLATPPRPSPALPFPTLVSALLAYLGGAPRPSPRAPRLLQLLVQNPQFLGPLVRGFVPSLIHARLVLGVPPQKWGRGAAGEGRDPRPQWARAERRERLRELGEALLRSLAATAASPFGVGVLTHGLRCGSAPARLACATALPLLARPGSPLWPLLWGGGGALPLLLGAAVGAARGGGGASPGCPYSLSPWDVSLVPDAPPPLPASRRALSRVSPVLSTLLCGPFLAPPAAGDACAAAQRPALLLLLHFLHGCAARAARTSPAPRCHAAGAGAGAGAGASWCRRRGLAGGGVRGRRPRSGPGGAGAAAALARRAARRAQRRRPQRGAPVLLGAARAATEPAALVRALLEEIGPAHGALGHAHDELSVGAQWDPLVGVGQLGGDSEEEEEEEGDVMEQGGDVMEEGSDVMEEEGSR
ncbi:armadillo repeat-containing protein 5 [Camarhynchus parvulus]|uniref:armadillo repeat-containing protein 5 n=1 Tax=Geospiza parvula TaxID=87175 RepID=UPI001237F591|nr:armadillo repeat-containing protein 5 [Camarhynchus parvulus]